MNATPSTAASDDAARIADHYLRAWNETDPALRDSQIAQTFSPDVHYLDPMMDAQGRDGLAGLIRAVQQRFEGHRFSLSGTPENHHDVVRFSWSLATPGAAPVARGTDVVELDRHGRLCRVVGFLDYLAGA